MADHQPERIVMADMSGEETLPEGHTPCADYVHSQRLKTLTLNVRNICMMKTHECIRLVQQATLKVCC